MIDHELIINLTHEYGGDWGINHAKRLLHLVSIIGKDVQYNKEAIWIASYLHDWGGYQPCITPGVEHYTKSKEVADDFLIKNDCPKDLKNLVLECIEFHHGGDPDRSIESKLFTDADALDLLGVAGTLKIFSMCPRDLKSARTAVDKWKIMSINAISFAKTRQIAAKRIEETERLMICFEEETFGYY